MVGEGWDNRDNWVGTRGKRGKEREREREGRPRGGERASFEFYHGIPS
jgi:hypothetical protein